MYLTTEGNYLLVKQVGTFSSLHQEIGTYSNQAMTELHTRAEIPFGHSHT